MKMLIAVLAFISTAALADGCVDGTGCAKDPEAKAKVYSFMDVGESRFLQAGIGLPVARNLSLEVGAVSYRLGNGSSASSSTSTQTSSSGKKHCTKTTTVNTTDTTAYEGNAYAMGVTLRMVYMARLTQRWSGLVGAGVDMVNVDAPNPADEGTSGLGYGLAGLAVALHPGWTARMTVRFRDGGQWSAGLVHLF